MTRKSIAEAIHDATDSIVRFWENHGLRIYIVCAILLTIPCVIVFSQKSIIMGLILGPLFALGLPWPLWGCIFVPLLGGMELLAYCIEKPFEAFKKFLTFCALIVIGTILLMGLARYCSGFWNEYE